MEEAPAVEVSEYRDKAKGEILQSLEMAERAKRRLEAAQGQLSSYVGSTWSRFEAYAGHLTEEDREELRQRMIALGETPHG